MKHKDWQDLIPFYIAKTLPLEQQHSFEQHLATCSTCTQEIEEWRKIAVAVWQEADSAAQHVTPLSQDVYNQLSTHDRLPAAGQNPNSTHSGYLPKQSLRRPQQQKPSRKLSLPITLVAGIVVAFLFGALLILLTLRDEPQTLSNTIAQNTTATAESFAALQVDDASATSINTVLPTQIGTNGILPTPVPFMTDTAIPTPSPVAELPGRGGAGDTVPSNPTSIPPPTEPPPEQAILADIGPYITITPELNDRGVFLCYLFNPTTVPIDAYAQATFTSPIISEVSPGSEYRALVRSVDGWYEILIVPGTVVWIPPTTAFLRGNCDAAQFWIPTPTQSAQATAVATNPSTAIVTAAGDTTVVVNSAFANFYGGPGFNFETVAVTERGSQFLVVAYATTNGDSWIQIRTPDDRLLWLWASDVIEYNNSDLPSNP